MANTFLKPEVIIATYLGILQREIVLPRVVTSRGIVNFRGAKNDTVTLRVPAVLAAREYAFRNDRSSAIVVDDLNETEVDVKLDKMPYSAVNITDEQLTLDIMDFGGQVLQPQVRAVAEKLESYIAAALAAGVYNTSVPFVEGTDDPYDVLVDARKALNEAKVPMAGRVFVCGADVEAALLKSDRISKAQNAGDAIAATALQEATINRVAGFSIVSSLALGADEAFALHPTAVVFATGAPVVPDGATFGAAQDYQGLAMRWLRDYDPSHLQDRSVVSAFAGTTLVADGPLVDTNADSTPDTPSTIRAVKVAFTPAP